MSTKLALVVFTAVAVAIATTPGPHALGTVVVIVGYLTYVITRMRRAYQ